MNLKIIDSSNEKNKRILSSASSGAYVPESISNNVKKYSVAQTAAVPITKNAQFAGSAAGVAMSQPMFFSPLHTPQNWQVPSKRREINMWSFIDPCFITSGIDFSLISISDMYKSFLCDDEIIFLNKEQQKKYSTINAKGEISCPDIISRRFVEKEANKINIIGTFEDLNITSDHDCLVIKRENIKCNKSMWNNKICASNKQQKTCIKNNCLENINKEYKISTVKAKDVKKGDFVLIPFNTEEIDNKIITNEYEAKFAGLLAADGCVVNTKKTKNTSIVMHIDEKDCIDKYIKYVFNKFNINVKYEKQLSQYLLVARSGNVELNKYASKITIGKGANKKFTENVMFIKPELQKHVIGGYIQADGNWNKANQCIEITTYSKHLANQLLTMCYRCNILARGNKQKLSKSAFKTDNEFRYIINIPSYECNKIKEYVPGKCKDIETKKERSHKRFFWKNFVISSVAKNESYDYEGFVYDIRVPNDFSVVMNGVGIHQCRFFYCFTPDNKVLMADGTEKNIDQIQEGDLVISGDGTSQKVQKVNSRYASEEEIIKIKVGGINKYIKATVNHQIPRINLENWSQSSLTSPSERRKRERIQQYGDIKLNKVWDSAGTIEVGDRLITPITKIGEGFKIDEFSNDMCYLLGLFAAEGSFYWYEYKGERKHPKGIRFSLNSNEESTLGIKISNIIKEYGELNVSQYNNLENNSIDIVCFNTDLSNKIFEIIGEGSKTKYISSLFLDNANKEQLIAFLSGYADGDGNFSNNQGCQIVTASDILSSQLSFILEKLSLSFSIFKTIPKIRSIPHNRMSSVPLYSYIVRICRRDCQIFEKFSIKYYQLDSHHTKFREYLGLEDGIYRSVINTEIEKYSGLVYDLTIENEHTYCVNRCIVHNSSDPKVAAGVDFYSQFSQNGFKLECKRRSILKYFERLCEKLNLPERLNEISHEYFMIGDVFPFLDIDCPNCKNGITKDGKRCNHPDGTFRSIKVLNPDYIDVKKNPISNECRFYLLADEELKMLVSRREPRELYNSLSPELLRFIASGQPIPLDNRCISHIKHNASPYGTYGTPLLQRLFTILAYKTKIMTANWIVAERLILPIRIVKVGDKERPADESDLQDIASQFTAVANDPNLTIVCHHAIEVDWVGSTGKIHNITQEIEQIGKEILDGLMLNQAILNGDAGGFASAQVGVEILIRRLENWRNILKEWVERNIFLPVAMMQGFIDEEESRIIKDTVYLYPKLIWNDLKLRDNSSKIQSMMQLYDKKIVSAQSILEELGLNYDAEIEKLRNEQILVSASGMVPQAGGDMGGGMGGALGGMGGGSPMGDMGGAPPMGDMGGGAPPMGGMAEPTGGMGGDMGASASSLPKVMKRGKAGKQEEAMVPQTKEIKFTKLEQKLYRLLRGINIPQKLYAQYQVKLAGEQRAFMLDFAYPQIGVCLEADGEIFHEREDFKQRDQLRDQKLANVGWRILRFREDAIDDHLDAVKDIIVQNIIEATRKKKKSYDENNIKVGETQEDIFFIKESNNTTTITKDMPNDLGEIILNEDINNG